MHFVDVGRYIYKTERTFKKALNDIMPAFKSFSPFIMKFFQIFFLDEYLFLFRQKEFF